MAGDDDTISTAKTPGSTLERIARELRRMKSRGAVRDPPRQRNGSVTSEPTDVPMQEATPEQAPQTATPAGRQRTLSIKRSLRNMRSKGVLRDEGSRPTSRAEEQSQGELPAFDAEEMRRRRMIWEAQQANAPVEA